MAPVTSAKDLSRIAYGFMASKALFTALNLDLFTLLAERPKTLDELTLEVGITAPRLEVLLDVCQSQGLVQKHEGYYHNAPACERYLVRGAPGDFGDYYRYQIDQQIFPAMMCLKQRLEGEMPPQYLATRESEKEAECFHRGQHAGSRGPAMMLARTLDLTTKRRLLDVGGGSGAMSIALCRKNEQLHATILDFPNAVNMAHRYISQEGMSGKIDVLAGDALETEWPDGMDVILFSYLLSAISIQDMPGLLQKAWRALVPGGMLVVHDFLLSDEGESPSLASMWTLAHLVANPDAGALTPQRLRSVLEQSGFGGVQNQELIPEITSLVTAVKS